MEKVENGFRRDRQQLFNERKHLHKVKCKRDIKKILS